MVIILLVPLTSLTSHIENPFDFLSINSVPCGTHSRLERGDITKG
jgi:hypothetical protein